MANDDYIRELEAQIEEARKFAASIGWGRPFDLKRANAHLRRLRLEAARARGTHTSDEWQAKVARFGGRCVRCGVLPLAIQKDHILPVYQGGSDAIGNLQPLCPRCNASKGRETTDWFAYRELHGFEELT